MKLLCRISALAACLFSGANTLVLAQEPDAVGPQNHDRQFVANLGAARMLAQTKTTPLATNSTTFTQLTGGNVTIPAGQTGYLEVTFSGESACTGAAGSWCTLRVMVDGVEIHPIVGTNFAFDSVGTSGADLWESNSIQRISNRIGAGSHFIEVEWAVVGTASFAIDDWLFHVEYWRAT
jgi:hypothetical protein